MLLLFLLFLFQNTDVTINVYYKNNLVQNVSLINTDQKEITRSNNGKISFPIRENDFPIRIHSEGYVDVILTRQDFANGMSVYLEKSTFSNNVVYVDAENNKISEGQFFAPITVKTIPDVSKGSRNIKYRFSRVSSVLMQESSASGGSPIYKGFRANKLLFTVNGIRFNNALFKSGNTPYLSLLNPVYFNHTTISDGANSLLFGSDAIGGSINLNKRLWKKENNIVMSGYQSGSDQLYLGTVSSFKTNDFDHSIGTYYSKSGDLTYGKNGDRKLDTYYNYSDSKFVSYENPQKASYKQINIDYDSEYKNEKYTLGFGLHYGKQFESDDFFRLKQKGSKFYQYEPLQWNMEYLSFDKKLSENSTVISKLYHQHFRENKIETTSDSKERSFDDAINVFGFNSTYYKSSEKIRASLGVDLVYESSNTSATNSAPKYPNDAIQFQKGLFVSTRYLYSEKLNFSAGFRYSSQASEVPFLEELDSNIPDISEYDRTFNSLTYSAGIHYQSQKWKTDFLLNSSFRAPNFDDLGKFGENKKGSLSIPNTLLEPEKALSLSLKNKFSDHHYSIEFEVYGTYLKNLIEEADAFLNGKNEFVLSNNDTVRLKQNINYSKAVVAGASLNLEYFYKNFMFSNSTSFFFGENRLTHEPLSKIPPLQSRNRFKYLFSSDFTTSLLMTYSGEQKRLSGKDVTSDDRIFPSGTPSYLYYDIEVTYRKLNFDISFVLENLFDKKYRSHASSLNGVGRSIGVSITYNIR